MKKLILTHREKAKFIVFSNFFGVIVASFLSQIASTMILNYFIFTATEKNVDLASGKPETLFIVATVTFLALISSLPLVACLNSFYLSLSRTAFGQRLPLRTFFSLFSKPSLIVKCSVAILVTNVIYILSSVVLVLPVFYMFCMTLFVLLDNADTSVFKALSTSRKLMKKKKMMAFKASLPFLILSLVSAGISTSLPMIAMIVSSVSEAMFYVTLAIIYNDAKSDLS